MSWYQGYLFDLKFHPTTEYDMLITKRIVLTVALWIINEYIYK